jgi:hypothetical protein
VRHTHAHAFWDAVMGYGCESMKSTNPSLAPRCPAGLAGASEVPSDDAPPN